MQGSSISIPSSVSYIYVGILASGTSMEKSTELIISPRPKELIIHKVPTAGETKDRPSYYPGTIPFYDKTLKKNIYFWNGWVDATGKPI